MHRIDTLARSGTVRDNTGVVLIEKDKNDKVFGFSFYAKRDDIDKEYIYDSGNGFEISKTDKTYEVKPGNFGFIGSPGGQMVHQNIFSLDSIYKKVSVIEKDNSYLLSFEFENDTVYDISDKRKVYELNKTDFFPIQIKQTLNQLGNRSVSIAKFSNVRINKSVANSIRDLKQNFQNYSIIKSNKAEPNKLLANKLPLLELPDLFYQNQTVKVNSKKLTLIDFWEVWCGPSIASFSEVENLKNKYSGSLNVVGIFSEDQQTAIKLIKKKGVTFQNLIGNQELKRALGINSWPTYFLVDKNGIVQKEYSGFTDQIEKDINTFINK